jgi:LysR family transcriptional activator of nhaA
MIDAVKGRPTGKPLRLVVGIADVIPKLIAHQLLAPALTMPEPVQLVCHEDRTEQLLADLSLHRLDFVISDAPIPPSIRVRAFSHPLGDCPVAVFAAPQLARQYRRKFPRSLDRAPFLLPLGSTTLRKSLEAWFESQNIRPQIAGEFADSALLKVFGKAGNGLFVGPAAIAADIRRQFNVQVIGTIAEVRESFYAISPERRLRHPAIVAVLNAARKHLFN